MSYVDDYNMGYFSVFVNDLNSSQRIRIEIGTNTLNKYSMIGLITAARKRLALQQCDAKNGSIILFDSPTLLIRPTHDNGSLQIYRFVYAQDKVLETFRNYSARRHLSRAV